MIDDRVRLYELLKTITPYTFHCAVDDYKNMDYPKIVYKLSNNYDLDFREGVPTANAGEYVIQVFEKVINTVFIEIHKDVLDILKQNGYKQIFFDYFRDTSEDIHIYTFRFKKINLY